MTPKFQQRHQDYVFHFPPLAPGQIMTGIPFVLDPDAPFILRSRALRLPYDNARTQNGLQFVSMRYTGPDSSYRSQVLVPQYAEMANFGQMGNPKPVWPNIQYPASASILIDVQNTSPILTLTGLTLYFRGVKLFPFGTIPSYTYPAKCSTLPFTYPQLLTALPVTVKENTLQQLFRVKPDADFVLRSIQAGPAVAPLPYEIFIQLLDENLKPYSNKPVHLDLLAGNSAMPATFPIGPVPAYIQPVGTGASNPGVFFPELYIPKTHLLYYYISRADAGYPGAVALNYPLAFNGAKVYQA